MAPRNAKLCASFRVPKTVLCTLHWGLNPKVISSLLNCVLGADGQFTMVCTQDPNWVEPVVTKVAAPVEGEAKKE